MSIVVYHWTEDGPSGKRFLESEMTLALGWCETLRKQGVKHVSLSSEPSNIVGKPGVTAVVDGKTPDGQVYDWKKRRL